MQIAGNEAVLDAAVRPELLAVAQRDLAPLGQVGVEDRVAGDVLPEVEQIHARLRLAHAAERQLLLRADRLDVLRFKHPGRPRRRARAAPGGIVVFRRRPRRTARRRDARRSSRRTRSRRSAWGHRSAFHPGPLRTTARRPVAIGHVQLEPQLGIAVPRRGGPVGPREADRPVVAAAELRTDRVRAAPHQARDIVGDVEGAVGVLRDRRIEHRIADATAVDVVHAVGEAARIQPRPRHRLGHIELGPQTRRRLDALRPQERRRQRREQSDAAALARDDLRTADPRRLPLRRVHERRLERRRLRPARRSTALIPDTDRPRVARARRQRRARHSRPTASSAAPARNPRSLARTRPAAPTPGGQRRGTRSAGRRARATPVASSDAASARRSPAACPTRRSPTRRPPSPMTSTPRRLPAA